MRKLFRHTQHIPGAAPGIEHDEIAGLPGGSEPVRITCTDYNPSQVSVQEISDLPDFISKHRPEWSRVRWICVDGLSDMHAIQAIATKYDLHPLAIEDLLHKTQRPKVESYGGDESEYIARLFIVTHALQIKEVGCRTSRFRSSSGTTPCSPFKTRSVKNGSPSASASIPRARACASAIPAF